jgi:hypothetical protein
MGEKSIVLEKRIFPELRAEGFRGDGSEEDIWASDIGSNGELEATGFWLRNMKETDHLEDLVTDGRGVCNGYYDGRV